MLCGLEGKPGITESRENQTDIYRDPRLYSMNYLKPISDLAQEFTWSPEGSNGSPITSAIQRANGWRHTAQNIELFDFISLPFFVAPAVFAALELPGSPNFTSSICASESTARALLSQGEVTSFAEQPLYSPLVLIPWRCLPPLSTPPSVLCPTDILHKSCGRRRIPKEHTLCRPGSTHSLCP